MRKQNTVVVQSIARFGKDHMAQELEIVFYGAGFYPKMGHTNVSTIICTFSENL